MSRFIDITGQRYNHLIPLKYLGDKKWECQCDCGNFTVVKSDNLKNGHTASCGCVRKKQAAINGAKSISDLKGKKFGRLTVLEYAGNSKWECQCECGNNIIVSQNNLCRKKRPTNSCGCKIDISKATKSNCIENTNVGNIRSQTIDPRNKTGTKGVCRLKSGHYQAYISFQKKRYYLVTSEDINVCIAARKRAEKEIFGDFLSWYDKQKNK